VELHAILQSSARSDPEGINGTGFEGKTGFGLRIQAGGDGGK
jgi:hypothetical protein